MAIRTLTANILMLFNHARVSTVLTSMLHHMKRWYKSLRMQNLLSTMLIRKMQKAIRLSLRMKTVRKLPTLQATLFTNKSLRQSIHHSKSKPLSICIMSTRDMFKAAAIRALSLSRKSLVLQLKTMITLKTRTLLTAISSPRMTSPFLSLAMILQGLSQPLL